MPAYLRIKEREPNFSEWIGNLLIAIDEGEEAHILRSDALRRQLKAIIGEFKRLYAENGVVRREVQKECYKMLEMVGMGDLD